MIGSFADKETERLFYTGQSRTFASVRRVALRKLLVLDGAERLEALQEPRGNRLEALKRDRGGQYSIRVNDRYRICFRWLGDKPQDVELVDYH